MKKTALFLGLIFLVSLLYGQSTTNNNTIIIQGNVYYFQPSNTPSSPLPQVGGSNFIGNGSWYGENAARAWASIANWAIERCKNSTPAVTGSSSSRVYISQIHAFTSSNRTEYNRHGNNYTYYLDPSDDIGGIVIYYWIVPNGQLMENGRRAYRSFKF